MLCFKMSFKRGQGRGCVMGGLSIEQSACLLFCWKSHVTYSEKNFLSHVQKKSTLSKNIRPDLFGVLIPNCVTKTQNCSASPKMLYPLKCPFNKASLNNSAI